MEDLLSSLPTSCEQVQKIIDSLNVKVRAEFSAKLALKYKDDPAIKPLIRSMLTSESLGHSIPVQKAGTISETDPNPDEPVKEVEVEQVKTSACKKLPLRAFGIMMACIVGDQDILQDIVDHPSTTLKTRAKDALAKLKAPVKEEATTSASTETETESPAVLFNKYWESIKQAPVSVPSGSTNIETRNTVWAKFERAPWASGRLKSIKDENLRQQVLEDLFSLIESHPPVINVTIDGKQTLHPTLPLLFSKNLVFFLRYDLPRTIRVFLKTVVPSANPNFSVKVLFPRKVRFWNVIRENNSAELVEALKPIFDALEVSSNSNGSGVYSGRINLSDLFWGKPVSPILFHLIDEAVVILNKILDEHSENVKTAEKEEDKDVRNAALQVLRQRVSERISSSLNYIWKIVDTLNVRLSAVAYLENKKEAQVMFEKGFYSILDRVNAVSLRTYVVGSDVVESEATLDTIIESQIRLFVIPSLRVTATHPILSLHVFKKYRTWLDHFDSIKQRSSMTPAETRLVSFLTTLCSQFIRSVKPYKEYTIFDYPKLAVTPPYRGIPAWDNQEIFDAIVSRLPPVENIQFWISVANEGFLTDVQKSVVKETLSFEVLDRWIVDASNWTFDVLDKFYLEIGDVHTRASELIESLKKKDIHGATRQKLIGQLKDRLDIRVESVREDLQNSVAAPSIDERVVAIERLLRVTNRVESVEETFKTLSWLLQKIRNEMKLNMDAIFAAVPKYRTTQFLEDVSAEEAPQFVKIYTTFANNVLSAVSLSYPARNFIHNLATDALNYFASDPSHPFFAFGMDILWRHSIHDRGREAAARELSIKFVNPPVRTREDLELKVRTALWRSVEIAREWQVIDQKYIVTHLNVNSFSRYYGLWTIDEGKEDNFTNSVVTVMQATYEAIPENENQPFIDSVCASKLVDTLRSCLGLRWSKSSWLMQYFDRCLGILEASEIVEKLPESEPVLAWSSQACKDALNFVRTICSLTSGPNNEPWFQRWSELRMRSVESTSEVYRRWSLCGDDITKQSQLVDDLFKRSPSGSALHLSYIMQFVLERRPELLKPEHISEKRPFLGIFNSNPNSGLLVFQVDNTSELTPLPPDLLLSWQATLLTQRYKEEALDPKLPMASRVLATSRMMQMKNISVHDIAEFLITPGLPSRIKESVLMFLPQIDEPGSAINLLLAPVFMESDLARTAIFAVKNVLSYMTTDQTVFVLKSLVPSETERAPKVTVYKELIRLFAEFVGLPGMLSVLPSIWHREKIHKDVRIVLLQNAVYLLSESRKEISEMAWGIVKDCVSTEKVARAGMVLAMVTRASDENTLCATNFMSIPSPPYSAYQYGELVTITIPVKIVDRYLLEVILPMTRSLHAFINAFPDKRSQDYDGFVTLLRHTFKIATDQFIQPSNAEKAAELLRDSALESVLASRDSVLFPLHMYTITALGQCTAMSCSQSADAPVPESWKTITQIVTLLVKTFFDPTSSVSLRRIAQERFNSLCLQSTLLPQPLLKSTAMKEAVMLPFESIASVPHAAEYYWVIRWKRRLTFLGTEIYYWKSLATIPEREAEFKEFENKIVDTAGQLMKELITNSFTAPSHGMPTISEGDVFNRLSEIFNTLSTVDSFFFHLDGVYESKNWCDEVTGFPAWRNQFKYFLLNSAKGFRTGTRLSEFTLNVMDHEGDYWKKECSTLASVISTLLVELVNSRKNLATWEQNKKNGVIEANSKPPPHDQAGLLALQGLIQEIGKRAEEKKFDTSETCVSVFSQIVNANTLIVLELAPNQTVKFFEANPNSLPFRTWVSNVGRLMKLPTPDSELTDPVVGLPALTPLVQKIATEALDSGFDFKLPCTSAFSTFLDQNIHLVTHIAQPAVHAFLLKYPAQVFPKLEAHMTSYLGQESIALLLESVLDGWYGHLDLSPIAETKVVEKNDLFQLVIDETDDGKYVQNPESAKRRAALFDAVKVSEAFVELWSNAKTADSQKLLASKVLAMKPGEKHPDYPELDSLARVGKIAATSPEPATRPENFVAIDYINRLYSKSRIFALNPYLYFRYFWEKLWLQEVSFAAPQNHQLQLELRALVDGQPYILSKQNVIAYAVPIRYLVSVVAMITRVVVPKLREAGQTRAATQACHIAITILSQIHNFTLTCEYNESRNKSAAKNVVLDALVLEAAVKEGDQMVIPDFIELVRELSTSSTEQVMELAMQIEESQWQLRWAC